MSKDINCSQDFDAPILLYVMGMRRMKVAVVFLCLVAVAVSQLTSVLGPLDLVGSPISGVGTLSSNLLDSLQLPGPLNVIKQWGQQFTNCALVGEWTDPYLGTLKHGNDYCYTECSRFIPGVTCCSPSPPKDINPGFYLFDRTGYERNLTWDEVNSDWAKQAGSQYKSLVIITHGYIERAVYGSWMYQAKDGYFRRGVDAVILLDWGSGNGLNYFQSVASVRTVGMMMGKLIVEWGLVDKTTIVGFSLGGQVLGEAGKYVQQITGGQKIKECHGIDPAGPFFDGCGPEMVLDRSDCELVQVVHTSAEFVRTVGALSINFGTYYKSGHCDYWVNCGYWQKTCGVPSLGYGIQDFAKLPTSFTAAYLAGENASMPIVCNHLTANRVYTAQVVGNCDFDAQICPECGQTPQCNENGPSSGFSLVPDARCDPSMNENFFVKTKLSYVDSHYC